MKTKLIFLIIVATFSSQAIALQHCKDKQIHFQMQTQRSGDNWSFKYCPPDTIIIEEKDSISENELDIEIQADGQAIIDVGGGREAEFSGGLTALNQYIYQNLVLKLSDSSAVMPGCHQVCVRFWIDERGDVSDIIVLKSAGNELDNTVVSVIKTMPRWIPASYRSENISTNYTLPIQIYLN